jgi:hypothetical protein
MLASEKNSSDLAEKIMDVSKRMALLERQGKEEK